jgi:hypothetical protein
MRPSRRSLVVGAAAAAAVVTLLPASSAVARDDHSTHRAHDLLRAPIAGSLTSDKPVFGVAPGGAPWMIDKGSARVRTDGRLEVRVEGLVIGPNAIPNGPTPGVNPVPHLTASLACNGMVVATTRPVPFSPAGDARIKADVRIPERCIAPVVMLNPAPPTAPNGNPGVFIGITGTEE